MDQPKLDAVIRYLQHHIPGQFIEHHADFDRDAQSFKVHLRHGTLLLKIADEVLDGAVAQALPHTLDKHGTVERLKTLEGTKRGLLVTSAGLQEFDR